MAQLFELEEVVIHRHRSELRIKRGWSTWRKRVCRHQSPQSTRKYERLKARWTKVVERANAIFFANCPQEDFPF